MGDLYRDMMLHERARVRAVCKFAHEALDSCEEESLEHGEEWDENCDALISARTVLRLANQ